MSIITQIPQSIPNQSDPIDLSNPIDLTLYIALPLLIIIAYLYWRRKRKSD